MDRLKNKTINVKTSDERKQEEHIKDLIKSVGLLPEFIIEPIKEYIKEEVTHRMAQEFDYITENKLEPLNKKQSTQHLIIMFLLLMVIITVLIAKFV